MSTPEDVAARAADSMAFLSDVERKAREACNYEVSDAYQNAWLVIRDLQTAIALLASPAAGAEGWRTDFENAKDGRQVLVRFPDWCGGNARVTRWVSHHDSSHDGWEGIYGYEPRYWAPLPADVASPAPAQATPPAEARDLVERYARAICTARGHDPETLHQVVDPTDYADTSDSHGHRFIYGWRKWVAAAEAVLALPAASEVRGQAAFSAAKNCRRKHGCFAPRHCNLVGECASPASAKTAEDR